MYWQRDKSPGLLACTVHTRGPNRGIGQQKSNLVGPIPRKQNGGFPQEVSNLVFKDAVTRRTPTDIPLFFFKLRMVVLLSPCPRFFHSLLCVRSPTLSEHCQQRGQCFRDYIFLPILFVVFIPQKWVFTVKLDEDSVRGNTSSCFDRFTLTF